MDACQYTVLLFFASGLLQNADFTTPPSARTAAPLVALAKGLHKNVVVAAISSGVSNRLSRLPEQLNSVAIRLNQIKLHRLRSYDDCQLGCELWRQLQLDQFWHSRLKADGRSGVQWQKVLALLVINRLFAPGSDSRPRRFTPMQKRPRHRIRKGQATKLTMSLWYPGAPGPLVERQSLF